LPDLARRRWRRIFGGSFAVAFYISAVLCGIAAIFSLFVLRPLVRGRIANEARAAEGMALRGIGASSTVEETQDEKTSSGSWPVEIVSRLGNIRATQRMPGNGCAETSGRTIAPQTLLAWRNSSPGF